MVTGPRSGTRLGAIKANCSAKILRCGFTACELLPIDGNSDTYLKLFGIYTSTALPFLFSGCTITLAVTRYASQISVLYVFDLCGAAAGCLLLIPLLNTLGAIDTVLLIGLTGAIAALHALVHLPRSARIVISILLLAPMAVLLGMPMPMGIRLVAARVPSILPWAWGINGATSVLGSVAALVLALLFGFDQTLLIGAASYFAAAVLVFRTLRRDDSIPQKLGGLPTTAAPATATAQLAARV